MTTPVESPAFGLVRDNVRKTLMRSHAFRALPPEQRNELAHDMVKVASYIVAGEDGKTTPNAVDVKTSDPKLLARVQASSNDATSGADLPNSRPKPGDVAGKDFNAAAAQQGGKAFTDVVRQVDFPKFVAGLIDGVFGAIVDSSIKQMEAYAELVANVAKSVDQYMKDNVSENQARDYLANRYPEHLEVDIGSEQPQLRPKEGHDEDNLPDFFRDLGLTNSIDSLDEDVTEETLVPAARQRIAMDRQQLLATMVLMGINRLVVTNGNISASVLFTLNTTDSVTRDFTQTATQYGGKRSNTRPGFLGWFQPSRTYESSYGNFNITTVQEEDSEATVKMKVDLKGKVDLNFKSETFPLERMASVLQMEQIQQKASTSANGQNTRNANPQQATS